MYNKKLNPYKKIPTIIDRLMLNLRLCSKTATGAPETVPSFIRTKAEEVASTYAIRNINDIDTIIPYFILNIK